MKAIRICFLVALIPMLTGCAITHDYKVANGIKEASSVDIIASAGTREGFVDAMTSWLRENGYQYNILPVGSSTKQKGWALTYNGQWSWDMTIFLAKASIKAYKSGVFAGESKYSVQGDSASFNLGKFEKAEKTIREMMSNLFNVRTD